jgi:hypothetical protein
MSTPTVVSIVFLLWSTDPAAAQSGTSAVPQHAKADAFVVTGCISPGSSAGTFVLSNATTLDAQAKRALTPPDKTKSDPDAAVKMSYALVGGNKLQAHLGHKVTITGTLEKPGPKPAERTEASVPPASGATQEVEGGTLRVQSLKMVSTKCP